MGKILDAGNFNTFNNKYPVTVARNDSTRCYTTDLQIWSLSTHYNAPVVQHREVSHNPSHTESDITDH